VTYYSLGERAENIMDDWGGQVEFNFEEDSTGGDESLETISVRIAPGDIRKIEEYLREFDTPFSNRSEMIRVLCTLMIDVHETHSKDGEVN
jgi:hypothetical protein